MDEVVTSRCNQCMRENEHQLLHVIDREVHDGPTSLMGGSLDEDPVDYQHTLTRFSILECCGCRDIHFVIQKRWDPCVDESSPDDEDVGSRLEETYFPPRAYRRKPEWLEQVERRSFGEVFGQPASDDRNGMPDEVFDLLDEIYRALQVDCWRIAVMGIRAIVDVVLNDKVEDHGGFQEKLESLAVGGFISNRDAVTLNAAIQLGHAVAHRGHNPNEGGTIAALDIVENMLRAMYRSPIQAQSLLARTPKRKKDK